MQGTLFFLVAGAGFEPASLRAEPSVLPLHQPAILPGILLAPGQGLQTIFTGYPAML